MALQPLYAASATVTSGREGFGEIPDGNVKVTFNLQKELGGNPKPGSTNPKQLFVLGWASCFGQAVWLAAKLAVHPPGAERVQAEKIVHAAHQICPYSNPTRGNLDVQLAVE